MTKRKTVFAFILAVFLFVPGMFLLSACGNDGPKISYIKAFLNGNSADNGNDYSLVVDYGKTKNLNMIDVKGFYTDGTSADLSLEDVTVEVKYEPLNGESVDSTLKDYLAKVEDTTLEVGRWSLEFGYNGFVSKIFITVNKIDDDSLYVLTLHDNLHTYLDDNCIEYGTKMGAVQHNVNKDLSIENIEESKIAGLYILAKVENNQTSCLDVSDLSNEELAALPTPKMAYNSDAEGYSLVEFARTEYIPCGAYYVCAKIYGGNNHSDAWTEYTKLKVERAKYFVETTDLTVTYTYNGDLQTQNMLFSEIMSNSADTKISGTMNLVIKSDMNDKNNTTADATRKLTLEEYYTKTFNDEFWTIIYGEDSPCMFGDMVDVNQSERYNFSSEGHTVKVVLVPNDDYAPFFAQSDEFKITLLIVRGTVTSPMVIGYSEVSDDDKESAGRQALSLYIDCAKTKIVESSDYDTALVEFKNSILVLSTNAVWKHNENTNTYTFYMSDIGSYYIKIFVNPNFVFDATSFDSSDVYTVEFQEETEDCCAYLTISWEITQ